MTDVNVTTVDGSQAADVNVTMKDAQAAVAQAAAADPNTAASLKVTDAQFEKFYDTSTKVYNWKDHAVDADYRATQTVAPKADAKPADVTPVTPVTPASDDAQANTLAGKAGLDFGDLTNMIIDDGDINAESYKALEEIGIPKDIVSDYINGVKDRAGDQVALVLEAFGGDEGLNQVKAYAQKNYTQTEMDSLDAQLADPDKYKAVVDMLRHKAGVLPGTTGTPVVAQNSLGGAGDGVEGYTNEAQMITDMRNPLYKTDPTFRQEVTRKVAAATYGASNPRAHTSGL